MSAEIYNYLQQQGFRELRPWDVWLPPDSDWRPDLAPEVWPTIGARILAPNNALDELGYILPDRFSVEEFVLRKMWMGEGCYWEVRDRFPHHLKSDSLEAASWDAVFLAVVRSVPVTLRTDRLWEPAYFRHNKKY